MLHFPKSPECLARRMASQLILGGAWIETISLEIDGEWADLAAVNVELSFIPRGLIKSVDEADFDAIVACCEQVVPWANQTAGFRITRTLLTGLCAYEVAVSWLPDGSPDITVRILDQLH